MSSPVAGKFQDHYEVLSIDPKSESEVIQKAYTKLAQKYHPSNEETGDAEKFEAVNLAFEVLSDPVLRPEFDKIKGLDKDQGPPKFTGTDFFDALGRESGLRQALLCILYDRRRQKPFTPSLSMRNIEATLTATAEELNFVMWYLKQKTYMASDDKSSLVITVAGMDFLEAHQPSPRIVMPFIKESALTKPWVAERENTREAAPPVPSENRERPAKQATQHLAQPTGQHLAQPTGQHIAQPTGQQSVEQNALPATEMVEPPLRTGESVMSVLNRALLRAEQASEERAAESPAGAAEIVSPLAKTLLS